MAQVRPVNSADQTGGKQQMHNEVQEALVTPLGPGTKTTTKEQPAKKENPSQNLARQLQMSRELDSRKTRQHHKSTIVPRDKSHRGLALVRPVTPGQLGMNNTHGSTPPNPTPDLPNRSMDLCKTLGIVGTPHENSIAKIWSTKTC
jgi:hypothetical protein